jgi:hypothetical protein
MDSQGWAVKRLTFGRHDDFFRRFPWRRENFAATVVTLLRLVMASRRKRLRATESGLPLPVINLRSSGTTPKISPWRSSQMADDVDSV